LERRSPRSNYRPFHWKLDAIALLLELNRGPVALQQPWFFFGHSKETSDFIADGLETWWSERQALHVGVNKIQIELDNGPEISSSRTQFMKRLVEFVDRHRVAVELVYLPPYHSKYNPIERCWGILEKHWNLRQAKPGKGGKDVTDTPGNLSVEPCG
jgi:hypothetical protein